jgi:hypothetical protein
MITIDSYFGDKKHQDGHVTNAHKLIGSVNSILYVAKCDEAYEDWIDSDTGTQISGSKNGNGDGGYRDEYSLTGAAKSTHKFGQGIDIYDPDRTLAQWLIHNREKLAQFKLWTEDCRWTPGWVHFQCVPPKSNKRIYIPSNIPPLTTPLEGQRKLPYDIK